MDTHLKPIIFFNTKTDVELFFHLFNIQISMDKYYRMKTSDHKFQIINQFESMCL